MGLRAFVARLLTPTYDQLIGQANNEIRKYNMLKSTNYPAAVKHRRLANELNLRASRMKREGRA